MRNAIDEPDDVVSRIAAATATRRRRPDYAVEVRALLDAARRVIQEDGRARVADIVAAAGLSNDAFYRHFQSKDALVAALHQDGVEHTAAMLRKRMEEELSADGQVRVWLDGLLSQTRGENARVNNAVLANSTNLNNGIPTGDPVIRAPLALLLQEPFAVLGSTAPVVDAELVTYAVAGTIARHLWSRTEPSPSETEYLLRFCISVAKSR